MAILGILKEEKMKKGLKRGLSLLVVTMMLTSMVPVSVMAEVTTAGNEAVVQPENQAVLQEETTTVNDLAIQPESSVVNSTIPVNSIPNVKNDNIVKEEQVVKTEITMIDGQTVVQMSPKMEQREGTTESIQTSVTSGDYEYEDINDGVSITKYIGKGGNVVIPAKLDNKPVLVIGSDAFGSCESITSVIIPEGVTAIDGMAFDNCGNLSKVTFPNSLRSIGPCAFQSCDSLTSIVIPEGVISIESYAFNGCVDLTSISLPKSVTTIEDNPFSQCFNLTTITISAENPNYKSIDNVLYDKAGTTLIGCPGGKTIVYIPDRVTSIGNVAFFGCFNLTNISLSERITSIGEEAFVNCSQLTSISVAPNNSSFTSVEGVFFNKAKTTLIACPAGKTSISIPTSVTSIENWAFGSCYKLTTINLPESLENIGSYAFFGCDKLTSIEIPEGVPSIGSQALSYCQNLSRVVIPESVTSISSSAFRGSTLVTIYGIPNSYAETYAKDNDIPFADSGKLSFRVGSFTADKVSGQKIGTSIGLSAAGVNGKTPYKYKFSYTLGTTTVTIKDYSATATVNFKPTTAGTYTLNVDVKDADGKTATGSIANYSIVGNPTNPTVISFITDKASGQGVNTSIQLIAAGSGGTTPYQYKFYYKSGSKTTTIQNFSGANTATFKPIAAGTYTLWVDLKDAAGKTSSKSISNYTVVKSLTVKSFTADKASGQGTGTSIRLTAAASDGKTPYQYKFYYKRGTATVTIRDFTTGNTATFTPTTVGIYTLYVDVKDGSGNTATRSIDNYSIVGTPRVTSFTTDKASGQGINTTIKLNAIASDGKTPYQYKFYYKQGTKTTSIRNFSGSSTVTFKPAKAGTYTLNVDVKDANGKISTRSIANYVIK